MKESTVVVLILVCFIAISVAIVERGDVNNLRLQLESERAIFATGPCGNQFVVAGLGENKDKAAIAGRLVDATEVSRYVQKETDGFIEIYEKDKDDKNYLIFRRQKQ